MMKQIYEIRVRAGSTNSGPEKCGSNMYTEAFFGDSVGDIVMLVAESLCWRLFSLCRWFSQCIKSVTNISNLSPTHLLSNIRHQHRCNLSNDSFQNESRIKSWSRFLQKTFRWFIISSLPRIRYGVWLVSWKIISDSSNLVYDLNADSKTCQDLASKVAKFIFWKTKLWN